MTDRWDFLVGDRASLAPIWKAYYIDPIAHDTEAGVASDAQLDVAPVGGEGSVDQLGQEIAGSYRVIHSAPVYLIDREGRMRVVFTLPFDPQDLVHDIRLLVE